MVVTEWPEALVFEPGVEDGGKITDGCLDSKVGWYTIVRIVYCKHLHGLATDLINCGR